MHLIIFCFFFKKNKSSTEQKKSWKMFDKRNMKLIVDWGKGILLHSKFEKEIYYTIYLLELYFKAP